MFRFGWILIVVLSLTAACRGNEPCDDCGTPPPPPPNEAPTAAIKAPKIARTGQSITLDASTSTDPEGGKLKFLWLEGEKNPANNFLDGLDLTDAELTFTPDVEGKFTYTVEVKDDAGNKDSATVTLEVSSDYVPPELKAPTITGVVINGITFNFSSTPAPVVFTTATGVLTIKALGTDPEDDADGTPLATVYSANVTGPTVAQGKQYEVKWDYNAAEDDDPFGQRSITVQVKDSDGLKSAAKAIDVRIVPRASEQLAPLAAFVDCGEAVDGTGLDMTSPRNTLAGGYDTAMANGLTDVYVAAGGAACTGTQVDYHGIRLWGLFDPADTWRRLTESIDKTLNRVSAGEHRYELRTRIQDPIADRLIYATSSTYTNGSIVIDGFAFELTGFNYYAISMTTPANDSNRIEIRNNEFSGNVTSTSSRVASVWVPGGILIVRGAPSTAGSVHIARNLFMVSSTGPTSRMQLWVDASPRSTNDPGDIFLFSNVYYGTSYATPTYNCHGTAAAAAPFAFCMYQYAKFARVSRNTFWATSNTDTVVPTIVSSGKGKYIGYGNMFVSNSTLNPLTFVHTNDDGAGTTSDGVHIYSAYPTSATANYLKLVSRGTGTTIGTYTCLNGTGGFGSSSPCSGAAQYQNAQGSFNYDPSSLEYTPATQPWRATSATAADVFTEANIGSSFDPNSRWDFDGFYGPADNGTGNGAKYNAGAFETLP